MPRALYTIEEYVVKERKRDTYWMVFNIVYNDIHAFKKKPTISEDGTSNYLKKEFTDNKAREEFLEFMKNNFPKTKLIDVFDFVNTSYLIFPYLGSIAVDCEKDDEVYNALCKKYEDETEMPKSNSTVFWSITYELALKFHNERTEVIEGEFGD
jgi:hypothetical protein